MYVRPNSYWARGDSGPRVANSRASRKGSPHAYAVVAVCQTHQESSKAKGNRVKALRHELEDGVATLGREPT